MKKLLLVTFMCFVAYNAGAAETTYRCRHYQADIDYWQQQYSNVVKENKQLFKELMEAKMEILEKGIKIPKALMNTEIIISKEKQRNGYYSN